MRKLLAVLLSLLFAVSVAACSDDGDDEGGSGSGTEESATDDESGDRTTTTTDGGESGDDTTTTAGDTDPGDDSGEASSDYCVSAERFISDESLAGLDMTDPADVAIGVGLLEDLRDAAPGDIQDDIQVIIDIFQQIATAAAEAGDDPEAQAALSQEFADEIAALDEATTTLSEFTMAECGIDITGGAGTAPEG